MFGLFKKNKINIWEVFAKEMNAIFIAAKYDQSAKTEIVYNDWKIVFDNFTNYVVVDNRSSEKTYTRVIVAYNSIDNFRFEIYNNGFIRSIEKFFGAQDIEIGRQDFDKKYIIKSNNEFKIKTFLQNSEIRNIIDSLREINIETSDRKGIWENKLPEKELELSYFAEKEIKNTDELKVLLKLFKLMIDQLNQMKSIQPIP